LKRGEGRGKRKDGRGERGGESDGMCSGGATGGFLGYTTDIGLAPLKLEHTQARTTHMMTESCFSQTEDHFPSPLSPFFYLISHPFSPSLLALSLPPFSPLPSPSPLLPSFISVPFLLRLFSLPSSPPLSFPPLFLEVGPLNRAKGFGGALCPQPN